LPGINGFLGTRASIMLDVVFVAMFVVLSVLAVSIYLVRSRRAFQWHKRIQVTLGVVLLVTVVAFEVDMQWLTKWEVRAAASPYFPDNVDAMTASAKWGSVVGQSLLVHLTFSVPTFFLWVFVIVQALRHFPNPPEPAPYSRRHKTWGWLAAGGMTMTALTGWVFYYLAFVAK
jgi:uncharacterized membrane protein YozB (DUF420 family)